MNNNIFITQITDNFNFSEYNLIFFLIGDNKFVENQKHIFLKLDETFIPRNYKIAVLFDDKIDFLELDNLKQIKIPVVFFSNNKKVKEILFQVNFKKNVIFLPQVNNRGSNKEILEFIKNAITPQNKYSLLGFQSYYTDNLILEELRSFEVECIRLAEVQKDLLDIEPIIREANFLFLDLSSLRYNEFLYVKNSLPAGFNSLEICKIFHYYGLSQTNQFVFIEGYAPEKDNEKIGAIQIAQYLWHFITSLSLKELYTQEKIEYEINNIENKKLSLRIKFRKCPITERWWFETEDDVWQSCSYLDFFTAQKGLLSNRLIKYYVR